MYELKRKKHIEETLKVGEKILTISIDPEAIARQFNAARSEVLRAQGKIAEAKKKPEELAAAQEYYGAALVALMQLLLGEENTETIVTFYEGNYVEMTSDVIGFINEVIIPQIDAAIKGMRHRATQQYAAATHQGKGGQIAGFASWRK